MANGSRLKADVKGQRGDAPESGVRRMMELMKGNGCFCCGNENAAGMHLPFRRFPDGSIEIDFLAEKRYEGWSDILHGGIVSLLFDELLGRISYEAGLDGMTARMEVRYRRPVRIGERLVFRAEVARQVKGVLEVQLTARRAGEGPDGGPVAEGTGKVLIKGRRGAVRMDGAARPASQT